MTGPDFLDNFNLLYNNIMSNQAPGLDITEIALFLTKAEQELVKDYFNPKSNPKQEGFEDSPKRVSDFSRLIRRTGVDVSGKTYTPPSDAVFIVNEEAEGLPIILISNEEYDRVKLKPYPYPPKRLIWKVLLQSNKFKLITPLSVSGVYISYIRMPKPFTDTFYNSNSPCELPDYMHPEVVQRSVELAKAAWIGDLNSTINMGNRVE